ncbi:MAG TPA: peroxiredoxin [Candidatus Thermoplasmatota archaeon]|nr:peroxiredoxin [Candidatus Thermoplasmatota archaeon]
MLDVGATAPPFRMPGSDGREWSGSDLAGAPYVLTFYPKDETPGCVAQVCALRDAWEGFRARGVQVFGVSRDGVEEHRAFVANRKLPYTLLSDATGAHHKAFDVGRTFGVTNRVSYLVGPDGRILATYKSNLRPEAHAEKMLAAVRGL